MVSMLIRVVYPENWSSIFGFGWRQVVLEWQKQKLRGELTVFQGEKLHIPKVSQRYVCLISSCSASLLTIHCFIEIDENIQNLMMVILSIYSEYCGDLAQFPTPIPKNEKKITLKEFFIFSPQICFFIFWDRCLPNIKFLIPPYMPGWLLIKLRIKKHSHSARSLLIYIRNK